jgi:hypothetical protein
MTVVGYNASTDTESAEPCLGVEMKRPEGKQSRAMVYIDEGHLLTEISLTRDELHMFTAQCTVILRQLEWDQADWFYSWSRSDSTHTLHLVPKKTEQTSMSPTLCGATASHGEEERGWMLAPVVEHPSIICCKYCLQRYHNKQHSPMMGPLPDGLERIEPVRCSVLDESLVGLDEDPPQCPNMACWTYNSAALCYQCMRSMSDMNSENEECFAPALATQGE